MRLMVHQLAFLTGVIGSCADLAREPDYYACTAGETSDQSDRVMTTDIIIHDEGTVVGFTPVSPEARSFFQENVASEPYQWMDGANPVGGASPRPGPDRGTAGIRVRRAAAGGHPEPQQRFPDQTQPDPDRHAEERGAT